VFHSAHSQLIFLILLHNVSNTVLYKIYLLTNQNVLASVLLDITKFLYSIHLNIFVWAQVFASGQMRSTSTHHIKITQNIVKVHVRIRNLIYQDNTKIAQINVDIKTKQ